MKLLAIQIILISCVSIVFSATGDGETGFPMVYEQDFENPAALEDFVFSDRESWFLTGGKNGGMALELAGKGKYEPAYRSPFGIGILALYSVGDFVLEADLLQTGREYGHRDLCLVFGFQDSSRFYYIHIASKADPVAHTILIVNDAPRLSINPETTDGVQWIDEHWHHIRIERFTGKGEIRVYFDDMDTPIMTGNDKTFIEGHLGFGSFDDSGKIDNIKIWSPDARPSRAAFFSRKTNQH